MSSPGSHLPRSSRVSPSPSATQVQQPNDPTQSYGEGKSKGGVSYYHYHGDTYITTNINNAPVTTIQHADNIFLVANEDLALLEGLPKQSDTSDQWNEYLENSRDKDVQEVLTWVEDPTRSGELVLWIHAPAGFGKSTLARKLQHELHQRGRLGAAIFLSQLSLDSYGPETIIQLIGAEIGRTHRRAVPAVAEAVRNCHGASVDVQLEKFVRNPLQALGLPGPVGIILDAVDEWRSHYRLIEQLTSFTPLTSLVRFILLGREEPREQLYEEISIKLYGLRPVSVEVMQEYVERRFERIEWEYGRKPGTNEVARFATMAEGLFVWLSTACSLLESSFTSPQEVLTAILYSRQSVGAKSGLANLYFKAIGLLFPRSEDKEHLLKFLGLSIVLQEPLPLEAFSPLSGIAAYSLKRIMSALNALQIRRPRDSQRTVYPASMLFHASFIEFLLSISTSSDTAFSVSSRLAHSRLGEACLKLVLSSIPPTARDSRSLYLSPASKYAVKYWPWHTSKGTPEVCPDWKETPHSAVLQDDTTHPRLVQWASHFVTLIQPGTNGKPSGSDIPSLLRSVASLLSDTLETTTLFRVPCLEVATRIAPHDAANWEELGNAYAAMTDLIDLPDPVNQAVAARQRAVDIVKASHPNERAPHLQLLAESVFNRAERFGDIEDVEKSILLIREVLSIYPANHEERPNALDSLATFLQNRFERLGNVEDQDEAIRCYREALSCFPQGHPVRSVTLGNLGKESIALHRESLGHRSVGHPDRSLTLNNLANALFTLFKSSGSKENLDEAIALHQEALSLRPPGNPSRSTSLGNLAAALASRCDNGGSFGDMEEAISLEREALALCPPGHPVWGRVGSGGDDIVGEEGAGPLSARPSKTT
ncbi:hypothetical protein NMY22_g8653 [Coprinellus aureogranulatus]|nr:hypothetical protein NMY22_g8653 [Coprinellus aureogranulatus]